MNEPAMPLHAAKDGEWLTYLILMSGAALRLLGWWALSGGRRRTGSVLPL
jgi:hypothetical protein